MTPAPITGRCIGASSGIKAAVYGACTICGNHLRAGMADIQPRAYRDAAGHVECVNWVAPAGGMPAGIAAVAISSDD